MFTILLVRLLAPEGGAPPKREQLIERGEELGKLGRALADAAAGAGRLLLVEGPAGIGKTSLLEEARVRARGAGMLAVAARGTELEQEFPYGVVRQVLEPLVLRAPEAKRGELFAGPAALGAQAALGLKTAHAPDDAPFATVHGLYWLVANLAEHEPLVLLIDDAQWADAPSLRFVAYLAQRLDGLAATVIASVRTGERGLNHALVGALHDSVGAQVSTPSPLSEAGVTRVLSAAFGCEPHPSFARGCQQASGGNPFLVRELAAALIADGLQPTVASIRRIAASAPPKIVRATLTRLGRLPEDAVTLARTIALLGAEASLPRVAALSHLAEERALAALDALIDADMVTTDVRLDLRHPVLRTAIYNDVPRGARSSMHRQIAALLQREGADLDAIAGHLLLSEPTGAPGTIATLRAAAANALELGAPGTAARYLERALAEGPERELRASVLMEAGSAHKLARDPQATECFAQAARLSADPIVRARAMIEQATLLSYSGDWEQAEKLVERALGQTTDLDTTLAVEAETMRAYFQSSTPGRVDDFLVRQPVLNDLVAGSAAGSRPLAMLLAATAAQRDEPLDRVRALAEQGWDDGRYLAEGESVEYLPHGVRALIICDQLDRAAEIVEETRAKASASGSVMHYLVSTAHDAWIQARRGDLTAAAELLRASVERAAEHEQSFPLAVTLCYCGDVLLERPDLADIAAMVEAIELPGRFNASLPRAMLASTRGKLRFAAGRSASAIADMRQAVALAHALGISNPMGASWRLALALMLGSSQLDEALELVDAELVDARRSGQARRVGVALRALGVLEPHRDTGRVYLEEAVAVLAGSPARLEYARALVELGADRRRRSERAAARAPLRDGLDLAVRGGAVRLADRARTELAATGARPRRELRTGREALTPSELRVALMAADGRTSQEIAQALFVTTKTIDTHLNHTYSKLGINSRKQISGALAGEPR
jgi:DNA-binding CsgD family transcriptional regulator/tetratricopeptide (TPR) repeat protein